MVNLVAAVIPLLHGLMKLAGLKPQTIEIIPGTVMSFWVPSETIKNPKYDTEKTKKKKSNKPVVVLVHGFVIPGTVTWMFQVASLVRKYDVYVPDLLFFGESITDSKDRSPMFQAECLVKGLRKLGVERCTVVGFSYGGMVAFKMAEKEPDLVEALVISGSILAMTDSFSDETLERLGFSSFSELFLPNSVKDLKALLSVGAYKNLWFPERLHRDYLEVMFGNRKEGAELLEALVITNKDATIPNFPQKIHLLWGEDDQIFNFELAHNMKQQLGEKVTLKGIEKAGHVVHLERPCVYNRFLKEFLAYLHEDETKNNSPKAL